MAPGVCSNPELLLRNSELADVWIINKLNSLLKAENLCLNSAMDDHIASSISQSAHSVILHEQVVFAGRGGWAWAVSLFSLFSLFVLFLLIPLG